MKNLKIKGTFISILIMLTLTLVACGSVKDDLQGEWKAKNEKNIYLKIKDDKIDMIYKYKENGANKKNVIEGKLLDEKDDYVKCVFDGMEGSGNLKVKDGILISDDMKFEKIK